VRVQLREKRDEAATRDRFWDITQSKIGQLTGTTATEESRAAEHAEEANKMEAKFGGTGNPDEGTCATRCACRWPACQSSKPVHACRTAFSLPTLKALAWWQCCNSARAVCSCDSALQAPRWTPGAMARLAAT
jgi:hypothetical protein